MHTVFILLIFFRKSGVPQGYKGATFHRYVVVSNAIGIHLLLVYNIVHTQCMISKRQMKIMTTKSNVQNIKMGNERAADSNKGNWKY